MPVMGTPPGITSLFEQLVPPKREQVLSTSLPVKDANGHVHATATDDDRPEPTPDPPTAAPVGGSPRLPRRERITRAINSLRAKLSNFEYHNIPTREFCTTHGVDMEFLKSLVDDGFLRLNLISHQNREYQATIKLFDPKTVAWVMGDEDEPAVAAPAPATIDAEQLAKRIAHHLIPLVRETATDLPLNTLAQSVAEAMELDFENSIDQRITKATMAVINRLTAATQRPLGLGRLSANTVDAARQRTTDWLPSEIAFTIDHDITAALMVLLHLASELGIDLDLMVPLLLDHFRTRNPRLA